MKLIDWLAELARSAGVGGAAARDAAESVLKHFKSLGAARQNYSFGYGHLKVSFMMEMV